MGLQLMKPTVEHYGRVHGIDTLFFTKTFVPNRLVKRNKIFLLFNLMKYYELVMWIDSDAMFVDFDTDIRDEIKTDHLVYMGSHYGRDPLFPNSGVIVIKRDPLTEELLQEVWNHKKKEGEFWWDQQGFLKCLGYENKLLKIISYNGPTKYTPIVGTLHDKWNSRPYDKDVAEHPIIIHYCGYQWPRRLKEMQNNLRKFRLLIGG
ncbi:hypothetical protein AM1BK_31110 [Neobacillus kokaensis]|uniref:Nucleotide-diphospho-sugar transferase domain-containing protein n=2 Tax=Neobacillus kokaensis TaxID=2759023 RepID=A0ABQ3N6F1_9BACI|nr:hypothetical protein AM1BK_31110 [Neobacillus kokaensis]